MTLPESEYEGRTLERVVRIQLEQHSAREEPLLVLVLASDPLQVDVLDVGEYGEETREVSETERLDRLGLVVRSDEDRVDRLSRCRRPRTQERDDVGPRDVDDTFPERTHGSPVARADEAQAVDQIFAVPCARRGRVDDEHDEFGREAVKHGGQHAGGEALQRLAVA